jgi:starch phosphorylase
VNLNPRIEAYPYAVVDRYPAGLRQAIENRLLYSVGKDPSAACNRDWFQATALAVRDSLVERWMETTRGHYALDAKRVYYLSMEFLVGRLLTNNLLAMGQADEAAQALAELGHALEDVRELEPDAGLGNGGLGRLAACFLDSLASLDLAAIGYGIRYEYGMFAQRIADGRQVEEPDHWLAIDNPWEFPRPEVAYRVQFGGRVEREGDRATWTGTQDVLAMAYDTMIPGHGLRTVNTLRLWSAKATRTFDLALFNRGDYERAVEEKNRSENVSRVLYPDDSTPHGRELRLRQQHFFVSASLQDILRRYLQHHDGFDALPDKVAIHLNDTHPALAVPELMRLLVDVHGLPWERAWSLSRKVFSYTNHTLMPEALETWPVDMLAALLPRHLEIVYGINERWLQQVRRQVGDDPEALRRLSLIDENGHRYVRMAHLAVVASHTVNGVSRLHAELMRQTVFADFARLDGARFIGITNGVTPRRWLAQANPALAALIDSRIGEGWRSDLRRIAALHPCADDPAFRAEFRAVKAANKRALAALIRRETGIAVDPASLFDVQIKRIHEYKRQLLNVLQVIGRYNRMRAEPDADWVPRTVVFAGKAASAYGMAKLIIRLIHDVARRVNNDPRLRGRLKVAFIPNYGVSIAETVIPAADLSEQISTAGTEASGTGNMKMALNGALIIGTEDGANIEIRDAAGAEAMFLFGATAEEVRQRRQQGYDPLAICRADPELSEILDQIAGGFFAPDDRARYAPIADALLKHGDHYLLLADYADYVAAQARADALFRDADAWSRRAISTVAAMGSFSSDNAIRRYAEEVWHVPVDRTGPGR